MEREYKIGQLLNIECRFYISMLKETSIVSLKQYVKLY